MKEGERKEKGRRRWKKEMEEGDVSRRKMEGQARCRRTTERKRGEGKDRRKIERWKEERGNKER